MKISGKNYRKKRKIGVKGVGKKSFEEFPINYINESIKTIDIY